MPHILAIPPHPNTGCGVGFPELSETFFIVQLYTICNRFFFQLFWRTKINDLLNYPYRICDLWENPQQNEDYKMFLEVNNSSETFLLYNCTQYAIVFFFNFFCALKLMIYLTSATCEKILIELKIIKCFLRSTMCQCVKLGNAFY